METQYKPIRYDAFDNINTAMLGNDNNNKPCAAYYSPDNAFIELYWHLGSKKYALNVEIKNKNRGWNGKTFMLDGDFETAVRAFYGAITISQE